MVGRSTEADLIGWRNAGANWSGCPPTSTNTPATKLAHRAAQAVGAIQRNHARYVALRNRRLDDLVILPIEKRSALGLIGSGSTSNYGLKVSDAPQPELSLNIHNDHRIVTLLKRHGSARPNRGRLLKRRHRLQALALAHPRNRRLPRRKILRLHRIAPRSNRV